MNKIIMAHIVLMVSFLTSIFPAYAAEKTKPTLVSNYLAVFDLEVTGNMDKNIARPLTDSVRREIMQSGKYEIIDRSNMDKILKEQAFQMTGCTAKDCAVEAGQLLGVGKIIVGTVSIVGQTYYLSLSLVNVESGKTEKVEEETCRCEIDELINSSKKVAAKLMVQTVPKQLDSVQDVLMRKKAGEQTAKDKAEKDRLTKAEQDRKLLEQKKVVKTEADDKPRMQNHLNDEFLQVELDLSLYKPQNKVFSKVTNGFSGFSVRTVWYKYYFVNLDRWNVAAKSNSYDIGGNSLNAGIQYPFMRGDSYNFYAGLGAKFESIDVNSADAKFANNAGLTFIGIKYRFTPEFGVNYDFAATFGAKYSDYRVNSFGLFWTF